MAKAEATRWQLSKDELSTLYAGVNKFCEAHGLPISQPEPPANLPGPSQQPTETLGTIVQPVPVVNQPNIGFPVQGLHSFGAVGGVPPVTLPNMANLIQGQPHISALNPIGAQVSRQGHQTVSPVTI